jgi:hypothetical protein
VEDEIERLDPSGFAADDGLDLFKDFRAQVDRIRVVDTVHVAEGQRSQVATALLRSQCLDGGAHRRRWSTAVR